MSLGEAKGIAIQRHGALQQFLGQEHIQSDLLHGLGKSNERTFLEELLEKNEPLSSEYMQKVLHRSKHTVSGIAENLANYLSDFSRTSRKLEVLHTKRIAITVFRERGGIQVGYHLACFNKRTKKYLDISQTVRILDDFWKHEVEFELKKKLRRIAQAHLATKLNRQKDYQPLELEIGVFEERLQRSEAEEVFKSGEVSRQDYNRSWRAFDSGLLSYPRGVYILSSDVGTGKTVFLRHLQVEILRKGKLIPIFLHASEIEQWDYTDIDSFLLQIAQKLKSWLPEEKAFKFLKEEFEARILLLIDGLDQISGVGTEYGYLLDKLLRICTDNLIVASRPTAVEGQKKNPHVHFLRLKPFTERIQRKYFGGHYDRARQLCERDCNMMAVPMLAYMVRTLIEECEDHEIANRATLYKRFIDYILHEYEHEQARLNEDERLAVRDFLKELSYNALAKREPMIQKIPLKLCHKFARKHGIRIDRLSKYGLVNLIFDRFDGIDKYLHFTHQSFQEFLAALELKRRLFDDGQVNQCILEDCLEYRRWDESIAFTVGLSDGDEARVILNKIREYDVYLMAICLGEYRGERSSLEMTEDLLANIWDENAWDILPRITDTHLIDEFSEKLKAEDSQVRRRAAYALGEIRSWRAVGALIEVLKSDSITDVRNEAADALIKIGSYETVQPLIDMIYDKSNYNFRRIAYTLGEIGSDEAAQVLIEMVGDENVGDSAAKALGRIGSDKVIEMLTELLKDENRHVRWNAARALGVTGSDKAIEPLIAALQDESICGVVAEALGEIGSNRAVEPLIEISKDEDSAVQALGLIGSDKAVVPLIEVLREERRRTCGCVAANALARIGSDAAVEPLVEMLKHKACEFRNCVVHALGVLASEKAVDPLIEVLQVAELRGLAAEALGKIGSNKAVKPLIALLKDSLFSNDAASALTKIAPQKAVEALIELLKEEDAYLRCVAAKALGETGLGEAIKPLIAALEDESEGVRGRAADSLGMLGTKKAVPWLIEMLKDKDVFLSAFLALEKIAPRLVKEDQDDIVNRINRLRLKKEKKDKVIIRIKQATGRRFIGVDTSL